MQEIILKPTPLRRKQHCNSNNHCEYAPYWIDVDHSSLAYTLKLDEAWEASLRPETRAALKANLPPNGTIELTTVPTPHDLQYGSSYVAPEGLPKEVDDLQQLVLNRLYGAFTHQFDQHNWDTRLASLVLSREDLTVLRDASLKRLSVGDMTDEEEAHLNGLSRKLQALTAPFFPDFDLAAAEAEAGATDQTENAPTAGEEGSPAQHTEGGVEGDEEEGGYDILDMCVPAPPVVLREEAGRGSNEGELFMKLSCTSGKNDPGFERDTSFSPARAGEMMRRLLTNRELYTAYEKCLRYNNMWSVAVCFTRWETRIREDNEFRVFVSNGRVTGIAQQKWYKRLNFRTPLEATAASILRGYAGWRASGLVPFDSVMLDVWVDDDQEAHLIECNPWGVAFSSGSSLFHWVEDLDLVCNQEGKVYVRYVSE